MQKFYRTFSVLGLLLYPVLAFSEEEKLTLSQNIEPSAYFGQIMISLVFILMIIFMGAWLLKRFGRVNGVAHDQMRVLANMAVGQRERIILLEVGGEQLLIGVTSSRVSLLHELKEPLEIEPSQPVLNSAFAQKLQEAVGQMGNKRQGAKSND